MESQAAAETVYSALGLRADPFDVSSIQTADPIGIKLSIRAASQRLLGAIDDMASETDHRPIVVVKADIPAYYHIAALAQSLRALAVGRPVEGIMSLYVPIDMMRIGRVRSVLHTAAEWASSVGSDTALGAWVATTFVEPADELDEWLALEPFADETRDLVADLTADAPNVARRLFGDPVGSRQGAEDLELLMRVSVARVDRLDTDPEEGEHAPALSEDAGDDPMGEAFVTPLGEQKPELEAADEPTFDQLVVEYVLAYTKSVLSPVVARGLKAYAAQGTSSMAEEMKVSKAPTKTLVAVTKYATHGMRAGAFFFDRFDMWETVPHELRMKIVSTLTSLRWALKESAGLVLLLTAGVAPEIEEAFGTARRVDWDFHELASVESGTASFDASAVRHWIASCSMEGEAPEWVEDALTGVSDGASLEVGVEALDRAMRVAAEQGMSEVTSDMVRSALSDGVEVA